MKIAAAYLLALYIGSVSAVDLLLGYNDEDCDGPGIICEDALPLTCCSSPGELFASSEARGDHPDGADASVFSSQDDVTCAIQISSRMEIPVCIEAFDQTVAGMVWFDEASRLRFARGEQLPSGQVVEGDPIYKEGSKVYIIARDQLARVAEQMPTEKGAMLEYFKKHATKVKDSSVSPIVPKQRSM